MGPRLWMTAIPRRFFDGLLPEPAVHKLLDSIMNSLLGLVEMPVSDYLVMPIRPDLRPSFNPDFSIEE